MAETTSFASAVSPSQAQDALDDLVARGVLDARGQRCREVLETVLAEFEAVRTHPAVAEADCPACKRQRLYPPLASEHVATCARHPAVVRLRALQVALRTVPRVALPLHLEIGPLGPLPCKDLDECLGGLPRPHRAEGSYIEKGESRLHSVENLVGPNRSKYPRLIENWRKELARALRAWERIYHREADPCPFCGAIVGVEEIASHVASCARHPASVLAEQIEQLLAGVLGRPGLEVLLTLVGERDRYLDELGSLIEACDAFDSDLGWNGNCAYARDYLENALVAAKERALRAVNVQGKQYKPNFDATEEATSGPAFARPVWQALLRVAANGKTPGTHQGSDADVILLREVASEALRLNDVIGERATCPSCGRPGIWTHLATAHVAECPAHPALLQARAGEANLRFVTAVLQTTRPELDRLPVPSEPLTPIQMFWPSARHHASSGADPYTRKYLADQASKLEFLLVPERRAEYPTIVAGYAKDVATLLTAWQRFRTILGSACPTCGETPEFNGRLRHETECPRHPAVARARGYEERLARLGVGSIEAISQLRRGADLARVALARLAEYVDSYVGSFGDDDRGRALVYRELEPGWEFERRLAKETLPNLSKMAP